MPIVQRELNELRARVDTLTTTLSDFMADHKESTAILTATLNDFMTSQKESMTILTALLKAEIDKNHKPEDTPISNGLCPDIMEIQPSMSTLEALAQNDDEGFTEYLTRWRRVYSQIPNRPKENELISKFVSNLQPTYHSIMRWNIYQTFKDLASVGVRIEAGLRSGILSKPVDHTPLGSTPQNTAQVVKCYALDVLSSPANDSLPLKKKAEREFTPLPMSYGEAFNKLRNKNLLKPLKPTIDPPADERPFGWDSNAFCLYHRGNGHDTEHCYRLKHKIQNMIDSGVISDPSTL
jgi:hypothetical protein